MDIVPEKVNGGGKAGSNNPLAFLGLKRVDGEDDDENDKSSDVNVDTEGE